MKPCELCDSHTWEHMELCYDCLREEATLENALAFGENERQAVELNGFFAWMFSTAEIESILRAALVEADKKHIEAFCLDDASAFDEFLKGVGKK